ncbi:hypothetical protein AYO47_05130 [Planctomyces sp. SCGC AG-212-M04]|nr:hypothetical protein AYO47_05130 [Planctomyces sp. SCGC AG-212-M04]
MSSCPHCPDFQIKNEFVEECSRCGLGRSRRSQRPAIAQDYQMKTPETRKSRSLYFERIYQRALRKQIPAHGLMLDLGCSDGLMLDLFVRRGWEAEGVEPYAPQDNRNPLIKAVPVESYTPDRAFDLITMIHSFEHMADPAHTLALCWKWLKPNGKLMIAVPNYGGIWSSTTGSDWDWLNPSDHTFHYSARSLKVMLEDGVFRVVRSMTNDSEAPSMVNVWLDRKKAFERGLMSMQPLRSLLFRLASLLGRALRPVWDLSGRGAELWVLAEKVQPVVAH